MKSQKQREMEGYAIDFTRLCMDSGKQHFTQARTVYDTFTEVMDGRMTVQHKFLDPKSMAYVIMSIDIVSETACAPVLYSIFTEQNDGTPHGVATFAPHSKDDFVNMLVIFEEYFGYSLATL